MDSDSDDQDFGPLNSPTPGVRLRLISDGTPQGTRVETEDGRLIKAVQTIDWHLEIGGFARCQIEVLAVPVDVVGLAEEPEGSSLPADPTAEVELAEPQAAPDGPGFPEKGEGEI